MTRLVETASAYAKGSLPSRARWTTTASLSDSSEKRALDAPSCATFSRRRRQTGGQDYH